MQTTWKSIYNTKEPEKGDDTDHSNDSRDSLLQEKRIPVQVEPVLQQQVLDSYASSREQERNDVVDGERPSIGYDAYVLHLKNFSCHMFYDVCHSMHATILLPMHKAIAVWCAGELCF